MNNRESLDKVIAKIIEKMEGMDVGSEEYKAAADTLAKLTDRSIEMERVNLDAADKAKQLEDERTDRLVKNCLTAAGLIVSTGLTVWGVHASFNFEKEGTITTIMGRGFINRLMGKK
ncbi:MAG: hypothetical protein IKZ08_02645 [Bacteroidales bacterium]|nr:hypothetical protein [Bacteroidales bacterium]